MLKPSELAGLFYVLFISKCFFMAAIKACYKLTSLKIKQLCTLQNNSYFAWAYLPRLF